MKKIQVDNKLSRIKDEEVGQEWHGPIYLGSDTYELVLSVEVYLTFTVDLVLR